jgi:hypothetical protein
MESILKSFDWMMLAKTRKRKKESVRRQWQLNLEYEFTGRSTPQRNNLAELGFHSMGSRGRAVMSAPANIPVAERYLVFREAFTYVTHTDGLMIATINGKAQTRSEHFGVPLPNFSAFLHEWGEAGMVMTKTKTTPKLHD